MPTFYAFQESLCWTENEDAYNYIGAHVYLHWSISNHNIGAQFQQNLRVIITLNKCKKNENLISFRVKVPLNLTY